MQEQKFIIYKSSATLQGAIPYIIVAGGFYNRSIYGEGYALIVRPGLEPILTHLEPAHYPEEVALELSSILKVQFESAKDKLTRWLIEQTAGQAADVRQLLWEQIQESKDLAILMSDKRVLAKFDYILKATNCSELEEFVSKARDMQELQLLYQL
jgi:hypothetical protein